MTHAYRQDTDGMLVLDDRKPLDVRVIDGVRCAYSHEVYEVDRSGSWGGAVHMEPVPSGGASKEKGVLISQSLPLRWPYAKQHDKQGRPVFTSFRQQKEALAAAQSDGEPIVYGE